MSGPKHLWSGDWQRESAAVSDARAGRVPRAPEPDASAPVAEAAAPSSPPVAAPDRPRPRRRVKRPRLSRTVTIAAAVVLVLAAAGWGASILVGSSSGSHSPGPGPVAAQTAIANPPASPGPAPRQVRWLGMEISTEPPGVAVVQTVALGTPADRAGINPGDVIVAIDGRGVRGATEIPAAVHGLARGSRVTVQLAYGSDTSQTVLTIGAPPSVGP